MTNSLTCNIGGREIGKRRWVGIASLAACLVIESVIVVTQASTWWRLLLLPFLYSAIVGFMQVRKGVCVRHALRGTRNMGIGDELISDERERNSLRGRGLLIIVQAIVGAVIITGILIFLPAL